MAFFNAVLRETPRPAWARIVLWIVSVTLGLVFAARGSSKLLHSAPPEHFANVAFPPWFLVLLGILEIGGGLLLVVPRTGTYGAGVLASIIAGVICTHAIVGWNLPLMPLLVLLAPLIVVGYARRPWEAARARFLAALDRYAEREIARERRWGRRAEERWPAELKDARPAAPLRTSPSRSARNGLRGERINMLALSRKVNERIHIGPNVVVTVLRSKGGSVRLGVEAPDGVRVLREELWARLGSADEHPGEDD